ncbi:dynein light chain Tctex-type protein 2-like [Anopheles darlingi]|uniref:dynein light chain Tctex-type protein 2-like n=1 Tax=Anopheles darlingi TaxID=43151 RepID=UPI0021003C40|nr:dynein light chain Tctex-type protein 2-like [Anopheles darlingi]
MANWGGMKMGGKQAPANNKQTTVRFSDTLTAALANRKNKYKDVSKDLNNRINREELEGEIFVPNYSIAKIKAMIVRVVKQQFIIRNEDGDVLPWKYDPEKNLEMSQSIAKAVKDRLRNLNLPRYRFVCLCSVVEKQLQGVHYKMKYILDPYMDNYVECVHDAAIFWIITTVFLVHKD